MMAIASLSISIQGFSQTRILAIANEGFLLSSGEEKVLIDALFDGIRHYPRPTPQQQLLLEGGAAPYLGVDLILATHFHDDHFSPGPVSRHLQSNAEAVFLSTYQAVERLNPKKVANAGHVRGLYPPEGTVERHTVKGIEVDVLNLHHGRSRPEIQNLGYIIHLGGLRILHVGDTEANLTDFKRYPMLENSVDVALLPAWFLTESRWIEVVKEYLRPRWIVAMHLASEGAPSGFFGSSRTRKRRLQTIRENFTDSIVLEPGESHEFLP